MVDKKIFKNTVLKIIELAGEDGIGAVKLNKCLIICDAVHKALYGDSLTGATYIKHKYGPVPETEADDILQELKTSGDIDIRKKMVSPGIYENTHYLCQGLEVSKKFFSDEEISIITWAVSTIMPMTAQQITEISHNRCYHNTPMLKEINLDDKAKWYLHDLRPIVMSLLSNPNASINIRELQDIYERINKSSHKNQEIDNINQ